MIRRCEEVVRLGWEAEPCGKPAAWFLEHVGRWRCEYWTCERHAIEALRDMGGKCSDASGEPVQIDPATGDLRTAVDS